MFARAIRLRCPVCGGGDISLSWLRLKQQCPTCSQDFQRGEDDYWIGAYAINWVAAETIAAVMGVAVLWWTWPRSGPATIVAVSAAIIMPIAFFPFSRLLWLAFDLSFRKDTT